MRNGIADGPSPGDVHLTSIGGRVVLVDPVAPLCDFRIVGIGGIGDILEEAAGDQLLVTLQVGILQNGGRRIRRVRHEDRRLPAQFVDCLEGLRHKLAGRGEVDDVDARGLDLNELGTDGRFGALIGFGGDQHCRFLVTEAIFQAGEKIAPIVVVLVQDADLRRCHFFAQVVAENGPFLRSGRLPAHHPWIKFRVRHLG